MASNPETPKGTAIEVTAENPEATALEKEQEKIKSPSREIKGNLPYTTAHGVFKAVLDGIISSERPDKFSNDFLSTVLNLSGGSARAVPPILKRMNFLSSDGTPTDRYSRFKSDSGRSKAALEGLKDAYSEVFRKSEFAHKAEEGKIKDLLVEITGLNKGDQIVRAIYGTFNVLRNYIDDKQLGDAQEKNNLVEEKKQIENKPKGSESGIHSLVYNINIVLPETENVLVFNAIFKSLKESLL